jgi:hypothetical protein
VLYIFGVSSDHSTISSKGSETHGVIWALDKDISRPVDDSVPIFNKIRDITKNWVRFQPIYGGFILWIFTTEEEEIEQRDEKYEQERTEKK